MKTKFLFLLLIVTTPDLFGQFDSVTTVPPLQGTSYSFPQITFNVKAYEPLIIREIWSSFLPNASNISCEIWYHPTDSINGLPVVNHANGWILAGSIGVPDPGPGGSGSGILNKIPLQLAIEMATGQVMGFCIKTDPNRLNYSSQGTPSLFSDGSLHINCGPQVGYAGHAPYRFNGKVMYERKAKALNNVGISELVSPVEFCTGNHAIQLRVANHGKNKIDSLRVNWTLNNIPQAVIFLNHTLDTLGSVSPSDTVITLTNMYFAPNSVNCFTAWTSHPNGGVDTVNTDDTLSACLRPGLSGIYTVGGSSADFPDFDAVLSILKYGVCGPVNFQFNPAAGPFTGGVEIKNVPGASAVNTITFSGNGSQVIDGSKNYILCFRNAKYITLDSFNIINTNPMNSVIGVQIRDFSQHLKIVNNTIDVGALLTTDKTAGIAVISDHNFSNMHGNNGSYINISGNSIRGGYYGIIMYGNNNYLYSYGNRIINNDITDFYRYGIYVREADTLEISSNNISRPTRTIIGGFSGIYFWKVRNAKVHRNQIHTAGQGSLTFAGIIVSTSQNSPGYETEIVNNAIYNVQTGVSATGIILGGARDYVNLIYNTININAMGSGAVRGISMNNATPGNHKMYNNLISITGNGTGTKHCIYLGAHDQTFTGNNNNYFMGATAGSNHIGFLQSNRTTLNDWYLSTLLDSNSLVVDPQFLNPDGFRPLNMALNGAGVPIPGIIDDIDGDIRSLTAPCIGADEFILYSTDAGIVELIEPGIICGGNKAIVVRMKNFGLDTLHSVIVNWSINGVLQSPHTYTGSLTYLASDAITLGNYTFNYGLSYDLKFWTSAPNNSSDQNNSNDTLTFSGFKTALSGSYTVGNQSGSDYLTLDDAIYDLNHFGVCGPVVISVLPSPTPLLGGWDLINISGTSAINTVTIQGNGAVVHQHQKNYFLRLSACSYITVDSFNFINTNPSFAMDGIVITDSSSYCHITRNLIDLGIVSTASRSGISFSGSPLDNNGRRISIVNNTIIGGYYGINLRGLYKGSTCYGNLIKSNTIYDFYAAGISLMSADSSEVSDNNIFRLNRTNAPSHIIGVSIASSISNRVIGNRIHSFGQGSFGAYGIYISDSENPVHAPTEVINNAIWGFNNTGATYGMFFGSVRDYINIYHNTIFIDAIGGGTKNGVRYSSRPPDNHKFYNNIVVVSGSGTGTKRLIASSQAATFYHSDNNLYLLDCTAGSNNNFADWGGLVSHFGDWVSITNLDSNSFYGNPVFSSMATGDLTPLSPAYDNIGKPLGILTDINGNFRDLTTPDVGAFEFGGLLSDVELLSGRLIPGVCPGTEDSLLVKVRNPLIDTINFSQHPLTLVFKISGPMASIDSFVFNSGLLHPGDTLERKLGGINLGIPGTYTLSAFLKSSPSNNFPGNDTLNTAHVIKMRKRLVSIPDKITISDTTQKVNISAMSDFFPMPPFFITEVCQFKSPVGAPAGGWPAYLVADDYIEITGVPNSDLQGVILEQWSNSSLLHSYTFPAGSLLSPAGTAIIAVGQLQGSTDSAVHHYYNTSYTGSFQSTQAIGRILKDSTGIILDAVGYGDYAFPSISGAQEIHWMGKTPASASGIRLQGAYTRDSRNWVNSSVSPQTPNAPNQGVSLPTNQPVAGFNWSYNGQIVSNSPDTVVGPFPGPGVYYYLASLASSCGLLTDSLRIILTAEIVPSLSNDTAICLGDSALISVDYSGAFPYSIVLIAGTSVDTISGISYSPFTKWVSPTASTTYTLLSFSDSSGIWYPVLNSCVVTVHAMPNLNITASADTICVHHPISFNAGSGFASYLWSNSSTSQSINLSGNTLSAGWHLFTVTVTSIYGCSAVDSVSVFVDPCLGLEDRSLAEKIKIYPNPNQGEFVLSIDGFSGRLAIQVLNLDGQVLFSESIIVKDVHQHLLSLPTLSNGVYFLRLNANQRIWVMKFIVIK